LGAGSVDQEESIQQDQSVIKEPSQPAAREQQQVVALASNAVGSLQGARSLRRDVWDLDIRNFRIETQVAEVQRASHG